MIMRREKDKHLLSFDLTYLMSLRGSPEQSETESKS